MFLVEKHSSPETRALAFLAREVPAWSRENGCFSCHNNGDAARALYAAAQQGFRVPAKALADTTAWVSRPGGWDHNQGDPGFSDQRLADIQFASSLLAALEAIHVADRRWLTTAAQRVATGQSEDGAWRIGDGSALGSPATYGTPLATFTALRILKASGLKEVQEAIHKAEGWLERAPLHTALDASTRVFFLRGESTPAAESRRAGALSVIRLAQARDGGFGPYPNAPSEAFDTAMALLALAELRDEPGVDGSIERGRAYLLATQLADGSWPGTTRPTGGRSYAQTMSTTGWATLALLKTRTP